MSDDRNVTKQGFHKGAEAEKAVRQLRALDLRRAGYSYREIARETEVSLAQAFRDVKAMIDEYNKASIEVAGKVKKIQIERIDAMLRSVWPRAINEDGKYKASEQDAAIDRIDRLEDRRSKLEGNYAPTRTESKVQHSLDDLLDQVEEDELDQETETDPAPEEMA